MREFCSSFKRLIFGSCELTEQRESLKISGLMYGPIVGGASCHRGYVSRKTSTRRNKPRIKGKTFAFPNTSIAAVCGVALFQYTEFVFMSTGDGSFRAPDIPGWRVHMISALLGTLSFVITLFCLEVLVRKSKTVAFRSVIPWLPFVVLTGVATVFHIHFLVLIGAASAYGAWMYWRKKRILPAIDEI